MCTSVSAESWRHWAAHAARSRQPPADLPVDSVYTEDRRFGIQNFEGFLADYAAPIGSGGVLRLAARPIV